MTAASAHTRLAAALADRYRIERELGQGGMATVYLAHDVRHDRKVAVKVLRPELAAVIGGERFLAEIRTTANLQHPHILPLFDSGQVDGTVFYVMPYVEGESLRDRLVREKQLPIADAVRIAGEIATALDYAHRHGVIHRDIKPENVLLHDGQALVADFGIALAVSSAGGGTRMTETGMSLGTPHYMSPEQAMGERTVDPRTDIYALGCVLYEMLAGEPPFTGPTAQSIVAKVMTEKPAPLIPRRDTVPPEVEDAVLTALAKLPADRFGSAAEFAAAISPAGTRTAVRRAGRAVAGPRGASGRSLWLAALAGATTTAAVAAVAWWSMGRRAPSLIAEERAQHSFTGKAWLPALSPDGTFLAYIERACLHGNELCRDALLMQEIGTNRAVTILPDVPGILGVRWTHDGTSVVIQGNLGASGKGLFVLPRLGGTPRRIADGGAFDTHPLADSALVAVPGTNPLVLRVVSLESGTVADSLILPGVRGLIGLSWAPDGNRIGLGSVRQIWLVDRPTHALLDSSRISNRGRLRWSTSGDALLVFVPQRAREDHLVRVPAGRRLGSATIVLPRVPTLYQGQFDVAGRTGRIAMATGDPIQDLWAFDLGEGRATGRQITRGTTWYGVPSISADGAEAYYMRGDALGDNLYRARLQDGTEEAMTAQRQTAVNETSLAPDARRVMYGAFSEATGKLEVALLELDSRRLLRRELDGGFEPILLPGGRLLLGSSANGWFTADSFDAIARMIPLPDSLHILAAAAAPEGGRFAALRRSGDTVTVGLVTLSPFSATRLATLEPEDANDGISWLQGTDILLTRWRHTDPAPSVWRLPAAGGKPSLVAALPAPCDPRSTSVGDRGRKAVCDVPQFRSDIWTVEGVGR